MHNCVGPEADDFNLSATSSNISLQWTVPVPLQFYPVIDSYNITYREKGATDRNKVTTTEPEASAVGIACIHTV